MVEDVGAKLAIQDLHGRYTDAFYRKSEADYRDCWASDGEWIAFGRSTRGRDNIAEFWRSLMKDRHNILHSPIASIVEVEGEEARGRIYVSESVRATDGKPRIVLGIYHDEYKVEDGRWRFARRWWNLTYLGPPDFSGRYWDVAPMGRPPIFDGWDTPNRPTLEEVSTYVRTLL